MELAIPIHTLQLHHMRVGGLQRGQKLVAPLSYENEVASLPAMSILLPVLPIHSYDAATGHLILSITSSVAHTRLHAIQETVLQAIRANQSRWFPAYKERSAEDIRAGFQAMVSGHQLHLYCPVGSGGTYDIHMFDGGVWSRGAKAPCLVAGTPVRIVLRIQGVAFHQHPVTGVWTGKFRLQHRILGLYVASPENVANGANRNDSKGKPSST